MSIADNNDSTTWRLPHSPIPKRGVNTFFNHSLLPKSTAHHRSTSLIPPSHRSRSRHFHDYPFEIRSSDLCDLAQPFPRLHRENGLHPHTIQHHHRIWSVLRYQMVPLPSSATSGSKEIEWKRRRWELGDREGKRDEVSGIQEGHLQDGICLSKRWTEEFGVGRWVGEVEKWWTVDQC